MDGAIKSFTVDGINLNHKDFSPITLRLIYCFSFLGVSNQLNSTFSSSIISANVYSPSLLSIEGAILTKKFRIVSLLKKARIFTGTLITIEDLRLVVLAWIFNRLSIYTAVSRIVIEVSYCLSHFFNVSIFIIPVVI